MTSEVIQVDTPGMTISRLQEFEWINLPRPIFPLHDLREWQAEVEVS